MYVKQNLVTILYKNYENFNKIRHDLYNSLQNTSFYFIFFLIVTRKEYKILMDNYEKPDFTNNFLKTQLMGFYQFLSLLVLKANIEIRIRDILVQ